MIRAASPRCSYRLSDGPAASGHRKPPSPVISGLSHVPQHLAEQREKMQKILVLEFSAYSPKGDLRSLTRKELLDEARAASLPEHVRQTGMLSSDLVLLKARDVRKVDPVFGGRLEPVILARTGVILVSLGRTELRALILKDRMYFIVPDGADSLLESLESNLRSLLEAEPPQQLLARDLTGLSQDGAFSPSPPDRNGGLGGAERGGVAASASAAFGDGSDGGTTDAAPIPMRATFPAPAAGGTFSGERESLLSGAGSLNDAQGNHPDAVPFEFSALEALLMTVCSELAARASTLQASVREALAALRYTIGTSVVAGNAQLEAMRDLKQQVKELLMQAQPHASVRKRALLVQDDRPGRPPASQ